MAIISVEYVVKSLCMSIIYCCIMKENIPRFILRYFAFLAIYLQSSTCLDKYREMFNGVSGDKLDCRSSSIQRSLIQCQVIHSLTNRLVIDRKQCYDVFRQRILTLLAIYIVLNALRSFVLTCRVYVSNLVRSNEV